VTAFTADLGQQLLAACDQYPYHELVAYACGITIGELREWLEHGAAEPESLLALFTRDYCAKDAKFAGEMFLQIRASFALGKAGQSGPLWAWFDRRWPCENPLAITTLLSGKQTEALSLVEMFRDPNAEVREALLRAGWFHANDLDNPNGEIRAFLEAAGWRRKESDAGPGPRPAPKG